ncbi:MAG: recombinase RecT [Anaerovoracaceae bacterium]|jgi:recombination protein RecT
MANAEETLNVVAGRKNTSLEKANQKNMNQWIKSMKPQIAKALPSVITPERFTRMAMTAISSNEKLAACTPESFIGAMMNAAQLGLEPNTPLGQAYLIPYGRECQFQLGYKGLLDLAHRTGEFKMIYAKEVYEDDGFDYEFGLEPKLTHKPSTADDRGEVTYYYAVYTLVNGGFGFEVMSRSDVEAHAKKFSKSYKNGPWQTNFDEMAKKTVIKKMLKYAPIKTEFVRQTNTDEKKITFDKDADPAEELYQEPIIAEAEVIDTETVEIMQEHGDAGKENEK